MKQRSKLSHETTSETTHAAQETRPQAAQEFASAEELLRFDATHTPVPPEIAARLKASSATLPPPKRSWWKNLFGR